ncbi:hypothetical protein QBC43DRAFT_335799 [Cladorrhinum sp. PSN259]|nr:hypothetical protein QBC43DRAFT_335799 [Cladorrhinum sp. PSN259]
MAQVDNLQKYTNFQSCDAEHLTIEIEDHTHTPCSTSTSSSNLEMDSPYLAATTKNQPLPSQTTTLVKRSPNLHQTSSSYSRFLNTHPHSPYTLAPISERRIFRTVAPFRKVLSVCIPRPVIIGAGQLRVGTGHYLGVSFTWDYKGRALRYNGRRVRYARVKNRIPPNFMICVQELNKVYHLRWDGRVWKGPSKELSPKDFREFLQIY